MVVSCGTRTPCCCSKRGRRFEQCSLLVKDIGMCVYFSCSTGSVVDAKKNAVFSCACHHPSCCVSGLLQLRVPEWVFLVSKCLSYGQFSTEMLMSPKRPTVELVPTTLARLRNHHTRRFTNVPVPAGIALVKSFNNRIHQSTNDPVEPTTSDGLNETVGDPGRRRPSEQSTQMEERRSPKRSLNTKTAKRTWHHVEAPCLVDDEVRFSELFDRW